MSSAREALIAEALGDIAALLDRVESIPPALQRTSDALMRSASNLTTRAAAADRDIAAVMENAKIQALRHIARRTDEVARQAAETQAVAMEAAGRRLFQEELAPVIQRLARLLDDRVGARASFCGSAMAHALTAIAASSATWALAVLLLAK